MDENKKDNEFKITDPVSGQSFIVKPIPTDAQVAKELSWTKIPNKKDRPELEHIQKAIQKKLSEKDFRETTEEGTKWENALANFVFNKKYQDKIETNNSTEISIPTPPKLGASQLMNINTLFGMLQRQNNTRIASGETPTNKLQFHLKDYAELRGISKEMLSRGGKAFDEIRRDLYTGAGTTYTIKNVSIEGVQGTIHGFPSVYMLHEPNDQDKQWTLFINTPYYEILNAGGRFYPVDDEANRDRYILESKKDYLYFFNLYAQKMWAGGYTRGKKPFIKISTILENTGANAEELERDAKAFERIAECLIYNQRYFNTFSFKGKKGRIDFTADKFSSYDYKTFKHQIQPALGINNFRNALLLLDMKDITREEISPLQAKHSTNESSQKTPNKADTIDTEEGNYL